MSVSNETWTIYGGSDVVGSDGEKVGSVDSVEPSYIVVKKGWFFPTDYYIPVEAIASVTEEQVTLNVTKDEALNQGWDTVPGDTNAGGYIASDTAGTGYATTDTVVTETDAVDADAYARATTRLDDTDTIRVPLAEEELTATRRGVERGQVRVDKDVIAEERTLEVPVTEERVTVNRRVVDRDVQAGDTTFEGGTIEVPVHGEEVELQKRTRVREELEIGKEAVQHTERVSGTVRREEAHITDTTEKTVDGDDLIDDPTRRRS